MASKVSNAKLKLFTLSLLSISLSLLVMASTFRLKYPPILFITRIRNEVQQKLPHWLLKNQIDPQQELSPPFDFIANELVGNEINIGLVNLGEEDEEWGELGKKSLVHFEHVSRNLQWKDIFPEWIDEEEKLKKPKCPEIPMPRFDKYNKLDVVVARVPCGSGGEKEGIRDMFRLQVNLVVANLVVRSSRKDVDDQPVYVVFIGSCWPMWEIFRCDDLLRHEGEYWIYKPDLRRLEQKVLMPVGSCQLAVPYVKHGKGKGDYDFSNFKNPINHLREAYVTVLHSSEDYVCGAIALAQSITKTNSTKELVLLADQSIGEKARQALKIAGWKIKNIERIESPFARKNAYNKWNYSKLRIWQLTSYDKVIFIDSDLIVLKNIDNFFMHPQLSAVGNSRVFNSGIMLIEPSKCVFKTLMKKRHTLFSSNGGDQGFLNEAFTWWHRWPAKLNYPKFFVHLNASENQLPESLYAIHYLGIKPWMCYRDYDCNWDSVGHRQFASDLGHKRWWQVYDTMPERLQGNCALSERMDSRIKKWRAMAENASLPDEHWKIKVKDPRLH